MAGDEVVQCYLQDFEANLPVPQLQLAGFTRIHLSPGETQVIEFAISAEQLAYADDDGNWVLEPGKFNIYVGGQMPNLRAGIQAANILADQFILQD